METLSSTVVLRDASGAGGPRRRKAMETFPTESWGSDRYDLGRGAKTPKGNGDLTVSVWHIDPVAVPGGQDAERQWRPKHAFLASFGNVRSAGGPRRRKAMETCVQFGSPDFFCKCRGAKTPKGNGDSSLKHRVFACRSEPGGQDAERQWRLQMARKLNGYRSRCRGAKTPKGNGDRTVPNQNPPNRLWCRGAKTPKGNGDRTNSHYERQQKLAACRGAKTPKGNGDSLRKSMRPARPARAGGPRRRKAMET